MNFLLPLLAAAPDPTVGPAPWHWFFFGPLTFIFWFVVIFALVRVLRLGPWHHDGGNGRSRASGAGTGTERARDILAERYARGEISTEEYWERRDQLV